MIKRTREQWLALFEAHRASGMTAAAFCKERGLCAKHFSLRRRQLKDTREEANQAKRRFVKALSTAAVENETSHPVVLRGAFGEFHFPPGISPLWLAAFVKAFA